LAVHPDPACRKPTEAATLAQRLAELLERRNNWNPDAEPDWNTVGVARYRARDWKGALDAFRRTEWRTSWKRLEESGRSRHIRVGERQIRLASAFFSALAHWRLGHEDVARTEYAEAVRWMDKYAPGDDQLKRFRAEAAALLGIPEPPPPEGKEVPARED
jgi:hypothetical protein